ncbi:hypothetical protein M5C72_02635 [Companilactobacillus allii]|uniref:DUF1642 domain-containing protein n=1 Tax=Companilactobacillus allii TaxID=1847728 RepID=A0A1P8Q2G6_9LACO|nr:hypothetical protein [Companilactobacillus allii]APX72060.1 hypothetical protein BTM29_05560 [Companilactobacillus allii]USQ69151.1 hypothetical protein M5C72_02635 [Companilactobacillus allii]
MDNVRILRGYSKDEQKELEDAKKFMNCNDLINNITSYRANVECGSIKDKYDAAYTDERISIIKDILDFYIDDATFTEPKKYYVHFIKGNECSYLNTCFDERPLIDNNSDLMGLKTKFTRDEVVAINPKFVPFMEEVEDDE